MKLPIVFFGLILFISGCNTGSSKAKQEEASKPDTLATFSYQEQKNQPATTRANNQKRIIVNFDSLTHTYRLYGLEYSKNEWTLSYDTIPCVVGYNGIAEAGKKREGDGKTPSGIFELGAFFGYDDDLELDSNFIELEPYHYWMSDSSSPAYNTLIDYDPSPLLSEVMERDDHLYKYGIVINYNTDPAIAEMGSAIFLHIHRSSEKPTAGCVAISEGNLVDLIYWLKDASRAEIRIMD